MKSTLITGLFLCMLCLVGKAQQAHELIRSVFFGGGSYYIDPGQAVEIRELVQSVPNLEYYQVTLSSHTDNIGGVEYNQWLSEQRSESVIRQLEHNLVPREKVLRQDNGQLNPWFDNSTHQGRQANRRVDIIFTPLYF